MIEVRTYTLPLHIFDPLESLSLWVNHERPASAAGDDHTVLSRKGITRQTLNVPVSHSCGLHHELTEVKVRRAGYAELTNLSDRIACI